MPGRKQDARVRYTKMVVKESLMELLRVKPVAKVTVTEICERAGINRATFYAHYSDPTDLLHSIETELIEGITERVAPALSATGAGLREALIGIFDYVQANAETCRVLLSDSGDTGFQSQIVRVVEEQYVEYYRASSPGAAADAEYVYTYIALGSVGVIRKWLQEGTVKPCEEIADLIIKLSASGMMIK